MISLRHVMAKSISLAKQSPTPGYAELPGVGKGEHVGWVEHTHQLGIH
jgi:hypothetical protein